MEYVTLSNGVAMPTESGQPPRRATDRIPVLHPSRRYPGPAYGREACH